MSESEFDKQVQQELQGLRLRPSTAVWENVEKELRRKKRRRLIIAFWLLAAIGLLGYSGYLLTQKRESKLAGTSTHATQQPGQQVSANSSTSSLSAASGQQPVQQPATGQAATGTDQATADINNTSGNTTLSQPENKNPAVATKQPNNKATGVTSADVVEKQAGNKKLNTSPSDKKSNITEHETVTTKGKYRKQRPGKAVKKSFPVVTNDAVEALPPAVTSVAPVANGDAVLADKPTASGNDTEITGTTDSSATASAEKKDTVEAIKAPVVKKAAKSSKVKWSLDLAVGGSGPIGSPFLLGNSADKTMMDNLNAAPNTGQGGIWSPGTFGPVYMPRSDIKPGPSARVGVLAEWPVSKRVTIGTGLQYQYQSNNIRIGYYKDTSLVFSNYQAQTVSVRAVYQGSQQKTFTNRYHYLQVPFNFQWQMNGGKKLPVLLNAGLSAGYLITTNGLLYDSLQGGIYYHDKKAFNRFQLSFSTGVSFRFGDNKSFQWSIGPEISMGLRKMIKMEYDKKQYPLFLGVQGRIYLPGRKR